MSLAVSRVPEPRNEPVLRYAPGTSEREQLQAEIGRMRDANVEVPILVGGEEIRSGELGEMRCPHEHAHRLGTYHKAGPEHVARAIAAAREAHADWSRTPWETRAAVFLKAAELLAGPHRAVLNAATMLGQSKTAHQAEIDSACESIDFFRFNASFMRDVYAQQPSSGPGQWNRVEYRPLEGFVFAVSPFNFTSIAANLATAPALMGNTVLWKPASSAVYSAYCLMRLYEEAGLPPGVINLVPGPGRAVGGPALDSPELAGIHFTGSTEVFQGMWEQVGRQIRSYRGYPRVVGETGGKDFIFAHASADPVELATAMVRGAFEYQGQKCSAASRAYVPESLWPSLRDALLGQLEEVRVGPPEDFRNFVCAVIDREAFDKIRGYIEHARDSSDAELVCGGETDDAVGYYVHPTVVRTTDPRFKLMREEIFGPVLTLFVYPDDRLEETLTLCDEGSPYGLTGAVFARDRRAIDQIAAALRHTAGNFYVNDKPTGAVVGQQPFGGGRASGTNDKAGSFLNLLRWTSVRAMKELFVPPRHFAYPYMG